MSFEELTAIISNVIEMESRGGKVSTPSHLHSEWRGKLQIGEVIAIGEVNNFDSHGAQTSRIRVTKVVDDINFTVTSRF